MYGLYVTMVCYVLLTFMVWIVVLECDCLMEFMDLFGSKRDRLITVSFMRILGLREVARTTARIALGVRPEFGISSWRGSRVDGRSYLHSGAIDGSEANGIIRDPKLELESSRREDVREVFQQRGSGAKRKLSRCGRNQMGNEPILALPEGAGLVHRLNMRQNEWMLFSEFDFEAKYHLGKANVDVVPWSRKKE
ncbi:hypothetical protein Tco_0869752 [Tanacetum coccineum]